MDIFLDLDGTLSDPFEGITKSIVFALEKSGANVPKRQTLGWAIGPALLDTFSKLDVQDPSLALSYYRERYTDVGLFENTIYGGVLDCLAQLKRDGHRLFLMTAKPHIYAKRITAHFGISAYLDKEFGPELDGTRNDKADLMAHAIGVLDSDPAKCIMVGDRRYDFVAARRNQVASIAARWGYGTEEEFSLADAQCATVEDLPGLIETLRR